jgi:glucosylceramidase
MGDAAVATSGRASWCFMMRSFRSVLCLMTASALGAAACSDPAPTDGVGSGGAQSAGGASSTGGVVGGGGVAGASGGTPGAGGTAIGTGGTLVSTGGSGGTSGTGGDGSGGSEPIIEPDVITSAPGSYWQQSELVVTADAPTITVNDAEVLGPWRGFGGTFNEKGWEALKAVSDADRALALELLFDRADGAAFTYGRIPIGSSDYALNRYSLNETPNDFEMDDFSIERDLQDLIPYIQSALDVQPDIHFWGSPWSPPTWMKTNGAFDRGNMKEDDATLEAHALYLARFVEEYEEQGIYVEGIHPQNEPGYLQDYPSCGWSAALMTKYIREILGPLFAERLPGREIWVGTMSNPNDKSIVDAVMTDSAAAAFVTGIGVQWGQDQYVPGYVSSYQVPVMQTEHRCGNFPNAQQTNINLAPNDDAYARESWGYIAHYIRQGASYYMAWNMVLDTVGRNLDEVRPWAQNALLAVDVQAGTLKVTPTYYVFRHVAQYVDPDSSRVGVDGGDSVAWKNPDGDIVVVFYNGDGSPKVENVSVGGGTFAVTVPGQGWATVNWQAP